MPITIPDKDLVKPISLDPPRWGGIVTAAIEQSCPVMLVNVANGPKIGSIARATGANKNRAYYGFLITSGIDLGATLDEEPGGVVDNCIVDGFAGVTPGLNVWVDSTAVPSPIGTFSGLTHTDPADGTHPIGVGFTSTAIKFYPAMGGA